MGGILGVDYRSRAGFPVINIPGCPAHPDWITETLYLLSQKKLALDALDYANRPAHFFNNLAHHRGKYLWVPAFGNPGLFFVSPSGQI
ncbi:MAG: hypothetical protein HZA01_10920 [Nitrospinae bacterium]|nr:hypothetical protein [Nitrospinota bacterium]